MRRMLQEAVWPYSSHKAFRTVLTLFSFSVPLRPMKFYSVMESDLLCLVLHHVPLLITGGFTHGKVRVTPSLWLLLKCFLSL